MKLQCYDCGAVFTKPIKSYVPYPIIIDGEIKDVDFDVEGHCPKCNSMDIITLVADWRKEE